MRTLGFLILFVVLLWFLGGGFVLMGTASIIGALMVPAASGAPKP